jgi:hypothetical protein
VPFVRIFSKARVSTEVYGQAPIPYGKVEPGRETLQPGDKVTYWKRISGADYVYPVQATVLALTEKRVKIETDGDREIVIRYVLQRAYSVRDDQTMLVLGIVHYSLAGDIGGLAYT